MPDVFQYSDYRVYLADLYEEKKAANPNYSYAVMAEKAGLKDKSCIYSALKGTRNLSAQGIFGISQAARHSKQEAEYFENLVLFNHARTLKQRNHYFERLSRVRKRGRGASAQPQLLRSDQYEFYANWYHATIRSIIDMYAFKDDYRWLAKMVRPPITPKQAKHSVALLERLGLISKQKDGVYRVSSKSITTGKEVLSLAVQNFHVACTDLAKQAIDKVSRTERNVSGLTLGVSHATYETICEEIQQFQRRIMELADADQEADQVYQLNFHLFPTSNTDEQRKAQ